MASPTTKCDIIRDAFAVQDCGACAAGATAPPAGCPAVAANSPDGSPSPLCEVFAAAESAVDLDRTLYDPVAAATDPAYSRIVELGRNRLGAARRRLALRYPGAAPEALDIRWDDMVKCRRGAGAGAGAGYFTREDLVLRGGMGTGQNPRWPTWTGGAALSGRLWPDSTKTTVPVWVDTFMNPDLFTVIVVAFVLCVIAAIIAKAVYDRAHIAWYQDRYWADRRDKLEAARADKTGPDPYPDKRADCRRYADELDSRGATAAAAAVRARCGLPQRPAW